MRRAVRALVRVALLAWPRQLRAEVGADAVDAALRGFEKRRASGLVPAGVYLCRVLADAVATGVADRLDGTRRRFAGPTLEGLHRDLRLAVRRMLRTPGTTLAAVGILGLGVGANTAVYSALQAVVLSPPPLPSSEALGLVRRAAVADADTTWGSWSYPEFRELRAASRMVLDGIAAYTVRRGRIADPGRPETVPYEFVTPGYFAVLSLAPAAGRFFTPGEEGTDAVPGVAVISHALWMQRFGGDAGAVGGSISLEGSRLRIVGVAPPGFGGLTGDARLWIPVGQSRPNLGTWAMERRDVPWLDVIARRRPGVDGPALRDRLAGIGRDIEATAPRAEEGRRVAASFVPVARVWISPTTRRSVRLAMAAAGAVLAIVVINLSALLMVQETRRTRGTALRLALGATRARVVRERLVESLLLTGLGGALGIALAGLGVDMLGGLWPDHAFRGPAGYIRLIDGTALELHPGALGVGLGLAALAGLAASVAPILMVGRGHLAASLESDRRPGGVPSPHGLRQWSLAAQVGLSVVLLIGSGLLAGTFLSLRAQQSGFDPERLLVLGYSLVGRPAMRSEDATRSFHRALRLRLAALPGVRSVSVSSSPPLGSGFITSYLEGVGDEPLQPGGAGPAMGVHVVDHEYFRTLGTPLLQGRAFTEEETSEAGRVAVVNREAARTFFADGDAVGKRLRFRMNSADPASWWTVVGVVEDVLYRAPSEGIRPEVYVPLGVWAPVGLDAMVRTSGSPLGLVPAARDVLADIDPGMAFGRVTTGRQLRAEDVAGEKAVSVVVGLFTALALVLSAAGLWATVAHSVAERHREIGVRMAVGASGRSVRRLFVLRRLPQVLGGAAAGVAVAVVGAAWLEDLLFGVTPRDPRIYLGATTLLIAVCLLATWLPARGATRIDPAEALRSG